MGAPSGRRPGSLSGLAAALRRVGELLVAPAPPAVQPTPAGPLEVVVTAMSAGAGASTIARGLVLALGAGPAVVRDAPATAAAGMARGASGRVFVAVADARREPAVGVLVRDVLATRHDHVVLVANRVRDPAAWGAAGALCVPDSRLGAWMLERGRRPPGAMGAALRTLAEHVSRSTAADLIS